LSHSSTTALVIFQIRSLIFAQVSLNPIPPIYSM
jgi:hypothetical protein